MSTPITGLVQTIACQAGRTDVILTLAGNAGPYPLYEGGTVLWNGVRCHTTIAICALFQKIKGRVTVTLHPRTDHYGASTEAEFVEE